MKEEYRKRILYVYILKLFYGVRVALGNQEKIKIWIVLYFV